MMAKIIISVMGLSLIAAVVLFIYGSIISTHLKIAAVATDKAAVVAAAEGFWAKSNARLAHLKTLLLAFVALASETIQVAIGSLDAQTVASLPWLQVFDAKVAGIITIVSTILIPITHSMGIAKVAVTPPNDPPPPATTAG